MRILLKARAVENQCFVISSNVTGHDAINAITYSGGSLIVSPFGEILADGGVKEGVILADLEFSLIEKATRINVFGERRRILDEIDDNML
jgi:predicted amidohydrolase